MKKYDCGVCFTAFSGEQNTLPDETVVCSACWSRFQNDGHAGLCGRGSYFCPECIRGFDDLVLGNDDSSDVIEGSNYTS